MTMVVVRLSRTEERRNESTAVMMRSSRRSVVLRFRGESFFVFEATHISLDDRKAWARRGMRRGKD